MSALAADDLAALEAEAEAEDVSTDAVVAGGPATPPAELRILSGMHAGARAPLDSDVFTLGTLDDCDFVLADPGVLPLHARLSRVDEGWQLDHLPAEGIEPALAPLRIVPGKAVPLGPVVVAVDVPDAPWPTLEQLVLVPHAPALEPSLPAPGADAALPAPFAGLAQLAPLARLRGTPRQRRAALASAAVAGLLSAGALVAWPMGLVQGHVPREIFTLPAPEPGPPDPAGRAAVDAAVARLAFANRVSVEPGAGHWVVRATALTDGESDVLGQAMARLSERPVLRITTEQDLRDRVADLLVRVGPEYHGSVNLRYVGEARFRLEGHLDNEQERERLMQALRAAFPHGVSWDNALAPGKEQSERVVQSLAGQGWDVSGAWEQGRLRMLVKLPQRDVAQWERALAAAMRENALPFQARMNFVLPQAAAAAALVPLPFQVRGVVGGDMPYVLLPDGGKLVQGGAWQGWRLASVSAAQVVFENGAKRAIVMR